MEDNAKMASRVLDETGRECSRSKREAERREERKKIFSNVRECESKEIKYNEKTSSSNTKNKNRSRGRKKREDTALRKDVSRFGGGDREVWRSAREVEVKEKEKIEVRLPDRYCICSDNHAHYYVGLIDRVLYCKYCYQPLVVPNYYDALGYNYRKPSSEVAYNNMVMGDNKFSTIVFAMEALMLMKESVDCELFIKQLREKYTEIVENKLAGYRL